MEKNQRGLGIGASSNDHFNTCDQIAPRLAAVTQIDYFLVDWVSGYSNKGVQVDQSDKLRFGANLRSLDPKKKAKWKLDPIQNGSWTPLY